MLPDNSERLAQLARARHDETLKRASTGLASMSQSEVITVARLAVRAGVSRSWLYAQHDLLDEIETLNASRASPVRAAGDSRASAESNRRRLEIAQKHITDLTKENRELRDTVARLHGQLREDAIRN